MGYPVNNYLLKVNNKSTRKKVWNMSKLKIQYKRHNNLIDVVPVFLSLKLVFAIFHYF